MAEYRCGTCQDTGTVCENDPGQPWEIATAFHDPDKCGGAGMPCPACCSPVPEDGTVSISLAFTPDWQRPALGHAAPVRPARTRRR